METPPPSFFHSCFLALSIFLSAYLNSCRCNDIDRHYSVIIQPREHGRNIVCSVFLVSYVKPRQFLWSSGVSVTTLIISRVTLLIDMRSMSCYKRALNNPIDAATLEQPVKSAEKIFNVKRQALKEDTKYKIVCHCVHRDTKNMFFFSKRKKIK